MYLYGGKALYNVSRVIVHPDYVSAFLGFDLALLKLATPVRMSRRVRPVTLPLQALDFSPEDECWLTGWGRTHYFGENAWGADPGGEPANSRSCLPGWVWLWVRLRGMAQEAGIPGEEGNPFAAASSPGGLGVWPRGFV